MTALNPDHFAIVIGIARYPKLGDPPPADLQGPENDADAILGWLKDPEGGGLSEENVWKIPSQERGSPPGDAPTRDRLEEAFLWLDKLAASSKIGKARKVGTRLYLYVSGHGFSPRFRDGCLLAGNAAERQFSANIFPSAWLDWLRDADYFKEYILWMDCCMDRQVLTPPTPPPLAPIGGNGSGPTFIAFAAPRPLKAAEKEIPPGSKKWHGVFTWNLLEGLRGAAANSLGWVTASSLTDWLRQAQLEWLDDSERTSPTIAKEPAIIESDDRIVFVKGVAALTFDVTLRITNPASATTVRLWSGFPPTPGPPIAIAPGGTSVQLRPGLYVAEGNGLRHGFAVRRSMAIDLQELGEPIEESAGKFTLRVDPGDPSADITLFQNKFAVLMGVTGLVSQPLDFGLYQFRIAVGRQIVEKVILLDRDWPPPMVASATGAPIVANLPELPQITSAAPLPGTRATHEYQQEAARNPAGDIQAGSGAELMIMARWFSDSAPMVPSRMPWENVSLHDLSGSVVANLAVQGRHDVTNDPVGVCTLSLSPGPYELWFPIGSGTHLAQSLVVPPGGWRVEAYLMYKSSDLGARPSISILMRRAGTPWGTAEDLQVQKACVALADERQILNDHLSELFFQKFDNPLAGIVGAHLLLLSIRGKTQGETAVQLNQLNEVVKNLRELVGAEHPDVEAISLACSDQTLRTTATFNVPPMFEPSWRLLLDATHEDRGSISTTLWQKIHAAAVAPPFLVWTADREVQEKYQQALADMLFRERSLPAPQLQITSGLSKVVEATQHAISGVESYAVQGLEKLGFAVGGMAEEAKHLPTASHQAAEVVKAAMARRARELGLPPGAIEVLRQQFVSDTAPARPEGQGMSAGAP